MRASSFNYHDVFTRKGMPGIKVPLPIILGNDAAGDIVALGPEASGFAVGDRVLVDPIERVKAYLVKNQMADREYFEAIDEEATKVGADLRKRCLELPDPEATAIWENVYATEHAPLAGERDQFTSYLGSFEEVTR